MKIKCFSITPHVDRILNKISKHTVLRHSTLPQSMNWDEFKVMAFIIVDNKLGNIFDIQDSRKSIDLNKYFKRHSKSQRDSVELISTDFFSGYIKIAEKSFRKADIVIDRFHIVTQGYVALNSYRINLCNKSNTHYNKLKDL